MISTPVRNGLVIAGVAALAVTATLALSSNSLKTASVDGQHSQFNSLQAGSNVAQPVNGQALGNPALANPANPCADVEGREPATAYAHYTPAVYSPRQYVRTQRTAPSQIATREYYRGDTEQSFQQNVQPAVRTSRIQSNRYEPAIARQDRVVYEQRRSKKKSAAIVLGTAGTGAAIGALAAGGKGAALGAVSGGAAGFVYDRLTHVKHY